MTKSQGKCKVSTNTGWWFRFPREDEGSPRQAILGKFCPNDLSAFRNCMMANNFEENKCLESKKILGVCSDAAFMEVNTAGAGNWVF